MALVLLDRAQQQGTSNTTVSFTLTTAVLGFQSLAGVGNGNTTYYAATDLSGNWEAGIGTYATGGTLTRTTILASSNTGSAVTFSGTVNVFITYPAEKSINYDGAGVATIGELLGYSDTGIIGSFASTVAGYNQVILQNKSTATNASSNLNVSNDAGTASTNYAELGINSSTFSNGAGCFNIPNAAYVASAGEDLSIGTYGPYKIHFATNSNTTDSMTIYTSGGISLGTYGDPGLGNVAGNKFVPGFTSITSAAGVTVLTAASTYYQRIVGTTTQTVQMPNATTLLVGTTFLLDNGSTGALTITDGATVLIDAVVSGSISYIYLVDNTTVAGTWTKYHFLPSNYDFGATSANFGAATITNALWNGTTIASGYGGTGLTTFAAANNALYSTSAGALAAGTLPIAAGGTASTTLAANNVLLGNGTSALQVVAPSTTGNVLTSNGTSWVSSAPSGGRSGVTVVSLSSGTQNVTLTAADNQLIVVSSSYTPCSITLPNMTTISSTGSNYFVVYNTSSSPISIKDSGGIVREVISAASTYGIQLRDNSTSAGVWEFTNPIQAGALGAFSNLGIANLSGDILSIIAVTSTQFIFLYNGSSPAGFKARLGTLNASTKTWTYGTEIALYTYTYGSNNFESCFGASDRVDRGFIGLGISSASSASNSSMWGFAIVAGVLYVSTVFNGAGAGTYTKVFPRYAGYTGSNNAFIAITSVEGYYNLQIIPSSTFQMFKVTVASTTVTVTQATGNFSRGSTTTINTGASTTFAPTSLTTFVYDYYNPQAGAFAGGGYVSCNTTTNVVTSGARTTQNTIITGAGNGYAGFINGASRFDGLGGLAVNSAGTRVYCNKQNYTVANVGTATVTVSLSSDITYKPFPTPIYNTYSTAGITALSPAAYGFLASSTNYQVIDSSVNYSFDQTAATFNVNTSSMSGFTGTLYPIDASNTLVVSTTTFDICSIAQPFKG